MRDVSRRGMEIIDLFIRALSRRRLNPRTIQEYTADLKHFIGWHEYQGMDSCNNTVTFSFDQISVDELKKYLHAMKDVKLKASTINRRLSTIKLLFDWAYHNKLSHRNPSKHVKLVEFKKTQPHMISDEEEKSLLDAVKAHGPLRDQAILKLMINTGIRVGEVCDLKLADVNILPKDSCITVGHEDQKRSIPLNSICRSILARHIETLNPETKYLFLSQKTRERLTERAVRHLIKKYMDSAGLEGLSAYSLRHGFGYKEAAKTPIDKLAQIMGHNSINPTMNYIKENKHPE